jgi:hypothetical protein
MINDPCQKCGVAYGHKGSCPTIVKDGTNERTEADAAWARGNRDAFEGKPAPDEDKGNPFYAQGREAHQLRISGQLPAPRKRAIRVPVKSEPRLAAVTALPTTPTSS